MIDSIVVALSGMLGNERGLNVISNNVANLNTPGFRGSVVDFGNLFSGSPQNGTKNSEFAGDPEVLGGGVTTSRTELNMTPGTQQQTGNGLDLFLQGTGFFVLQNADGGTEYTRDGSFHFDTAGDLVTANESLKVMAETASGELVPINLQTLQVSAPKATTTVKLQGSLAEEDSSFTLSNVKVFDQLGTPHTLQLQFTKNTSTTDPGAPGNPAPTPGAPGAPSTPTAPSPGSTVAWAVAVSENGQQVGSGSVSFDAVTGVISPSSSTLSMNLTLQGTNAASIDFDFSQVNGDAIPQQGGGGSGSTSTSGNSNVSVEKQDGFAQGTLTSQTFDQNGILKLTYSNGQSIDGPALAFAEIPDTDNLVEEANSVFLYQGSKTVSLRKAGPDLQVISQSLEASNVDLTTEFSTLILMQRGYQGASQVVSTANDMLQQLLQMRGGR
jgi:flagellar hook protein FlgE